MTWKEREVWNAAKQFKRFTRRDLAALLDLSENLISTYVSRLRRQGKIVNTGSRIKYHDGRGRPLTEYQPR